MNVFINRYLSGSPDAASEIRRLDHLASEGKMSWDDLLAEIINISGVNQEEATKVLDTNPQNLELFSYLGADLRPSYKIGFLSNAADNWLSELFTADQIAMFDDFVLSYEHGMRKPDTKIYELSASRLKVLPSECVFVDDVEVYCQGARSAGMSSVRYESFGKMKVDLEELVDQETH